MSIKLFDNILRKGLRENKVPMKNQKSKDWYRKAGQSLGVVSENKLFKDDIGRLTNSPDIGKLYLYKYDAKYKDELPYWDARPLVFFFNEDKDHLWGINLHYLDLKSRAALMDLLYENIINEGNNANTKLKITYNILKGMASTKYYSPCVKQYLKDHVKSSFLEIKPREWDMVLWMNTAAWQKKTANFVYAQSRKRF
jgi:hypothetical protein